MQTSKDYLHVFLDMGDALLNSGAEIFRVEDTLNRMGYACGATHMNVFVITSSIVILWNFPEMVHGRRHGAFMNVGGMISPSWSSSMT